MASHGETQRLGQLLLRRHYSDSSEFQVVCLKVTLWYVRAYFMFIVTLFHSRPHGDHVCKKLLGVSGACRTPDPLCRQVWQCSQWQRQAFASGTNDAVKIQTMLSKLVLIMIVFLQQFLLRQQIQGVLIEDPPSRWGTHTSVSLTQLTHERLIRWAQRSAQLMLWLLTRVTRQLLDFTSETAWNLSS